ncbi:RNA-guided endonuclease TnpB family protein, partial [Streptomyces sp. NPDC000983]|uniref:RNA-guided endonuclease TnpB family protein n=1 Tax=Streptomyces sp. NPDC000983 TaxID=3154373 RepID=UPI003321E978
MSGAEAAAGTAGDVNKDGYRDVVLSAPDATVAGRAKAGAVVVLYGGARGIDPARRTVLTQNSTGVPGAAESGDRFGAAVVVSDLDRDGYGDLVIGAPGEDLAGDDGGGTVTVVYGTSSGLTKAKSVQDPWPYSHDAYGRTLAVGTYDGLNPVNDGKLSIAVGANGTEVAYIPADLSPQTGTSGTGFPYNPAHGIVAMTAIDLPAGNDDRLIVHGRGDSDGGFGYDGTGDDPRTFFADPAGFQDATLPAGLTSAVGDLDGNGSPDLVVGNPEDPSQGPDSALGGKVTIYYGAGYTGSPSRVQTITQATAGVPGAGEAKDRFGASLAIGDTDKDGRADLVIGAPGENGASGTDGRHITLPRLGTIRTHEPTAGLLARVQAGTARILSATVRQTRGHWFVSFQVEVKRDLLRVARPDVAVGIDLGVKTLAVMADSTGEIREVANPRHLEAALKQLRRASRVVSRRRGPDRRSGQKPSKRWDKANAQRNKVHHRVANLRADALHKLTTSVAGQYGTVVVEDLNVAGMLRNRRLARRIADAGFGEIRRQLAYKTRRNG